MTSKQKESIVQAVIDQLNHMINRRNERVAQRLYDSAKVFDDYINELEDALKAFQNENIDK